ncbi:PQ-loop repeat-containing protein [Mycoplasma phocimorsus]|uniref:PQ-loop domain-containing transporter n=1 Tax=Mycoplasma phocimorsus TaxID=3045839 RepID=A0AAJ1PTN0_9MOLU|nr:PQ-loop domain-containing transporter [Mycoplasma phocimorsus]MDJ1645665.1 PQ-loop domain-containing transporter [Mycoplasma phocimorsus]MDJ1646187.1 PQ-loop domain-containing transporter [Mycoplasma phocimorsus]MDJ1646784.1 PQ-loop domain-containing transporter [Mycoplasma phocimorsus]MDJ1647759.1 PQ-loop domain-containing transporter [Mycoplasma phocimorsus]MDJ1648293.1 PQ-loop domain-containing transporter [Mycoplasma phocimorsus]
MKEFFRLWAEHDKFGYMGKIGFICGVFALVITVLLALPQFIKVVKERKTGKNVNFTSFWIFNSGLLLWIVFAGFMPGGLVPPLVANLASVLLYSVMIFFLYFYKEWENKEAKRKGLIIVGAILTLKGIFAIILSALWLTDQSVNVQILDNGIVDRTNAILPVITQEWLQIAMGVIIPIFTAVAFIPQIIEGFKRKSFQGVSLVFSLAALVMNVLWWMYWFAFGLGQSFSVVSILTLSWQTVSIAIFLINFAGSLIYSEKSIQQAA